MNHLNSVLLEGTICSDPAFDKGITMVSFSMESLHKARGATKALVIFRSNNLPNLKGFIKKGTGLRVVGHLGNMLSELYIEAEHIEIKHSKVSAEAHDAQESL